MDTDKKLWIKVPPLAQIFDEIKDLDGGFVVGGWNEISLAFFFC